MIQRIQSLFLLIAAVGFGLQFLTSFASSSEVLQGFFSDQLYNVQDHPALFILTILGAVISVITIFLFKKRVLQLKLSYLLITLAILLPIVAILLFMNLENLDAAGEINDQAGLYLPLLPIIFSALAIRYINKDEKIVKSMDRLR